nr:hypothetical protein [Endozoicomonas sp.]
RFRIVPDIITNFRITSSLNPLYLVEKLIRIKRKSRNPIQPAPLITRQHERRSGSNRAEFTNNEPIHFTVDASLPDFRSYCVTQQIA